MVVLHGERVCEAIFAQQIGVGRHSLRNSSHKNLLYQSDSLRIRLWSKKQSVWLADGYSYELLPICKNVWFWAHPAMGCVRSYEHYLHSGLLFAKPPPSNDVWLRFEQSITQGKYKKTKEWVLMGECAQALFHSWRIALVFLTLCFSVRLETRLEWASVRFKVWSAGCLFFFFFFFFFFFSFLHLDYFREEGKEREKKREREREKKRERENQSSKQQKLPGWSCQ